MNGITASDGLLIAFVITPTALEFSFGNVRTFKSVGIDDLWAVAARP